MKRAKFLFAVICAAVVLSCVIDEGNHYFYETGSKSVEAVTLCEKILMRNAGIFDLVLLSNEYVATPEDLRPAVVDAYFGSWKPEIQENRIVLTTTWNSVWRIETGGGSLSEVGSRWTAVRGTKADFGFVSLKDTVKFHRLQDGRLEIEGRSLENFDSDERVDCRYRFTVEVLKTENRYKFGYRLSGTGNYSVRSDFFSAKPLHMDMTAGTVLIPAAPRKSYGDIPSAEYRLVVYNEDMDTPDNFVVVVSQDDRGTRLDVEYDGVTETWWR